jgi:peptide/nickel transport system permease protein
VRNPFTHPYFSFVCKKVVFYMIVAFVAISFVFLIPRLMPGNPVEVMIKPHRSGTGPNMTAVTSALMKYFGLDKPLYQQYINFWVQLANGNLGVSFSLSPGQPVEKIVLYYLPFTLVLVVPVLVISFFLGNWIGAKAAFVGGKWSDFAYFFSVFANTLPSYWFGMVLLFLLAAKVQLFPTYGYCSLGVIPSVSIGFFLDLSYHYFLPFFALLFVYIGGWATGMRAMTIYEMDSGYVRYSEQLGFRKKKLMSYAQRNAILPQFTGLNLYLNALIGETMIIEIIFGWPGIGLLTFNAVEGLDYPLIFGCFLVTMVVVILGNFLIDILYGFIDPRIRTGYRR